MEINWYIVVPVLVLAIILVVFIIKRNVKDEKQLETFLNENELQREEDEVEANNPQP